MNNMKFRQFQEDDLTEASFDPVFSLLDPSQAANYVSIGLRGQSRGPIIPINCSLDPVNGQKRNSSSRLTFYTRHCLI
jgi:hypothetical protein